jgi:predicted DNA-binding protein with PD1-like motif
MKSAKLDDNVYALRLDPGDDIHASIENYCAQYDLANAQITGIGSVENPKLAHYSMKTREFTDKAFEGIYEITALMGNVALVDGKPFAHLHVTIAGPDMDAHAGHLVQGIASATLEVIITVYYSRHHKTDNDEVGLKTWDFEH